MNRILSLFCLAAVLLTGCKKSAGPGAATYDFSYNGDLYTYETVSFQSTVPAGKTLRWTFGDGATSTDSLPRHVYHGSGSFMVSLVVNGDSAHGIIKNIAIGSTTGRMALSGTFTTGTNVGQNLIWPIDLSSAWWSNAYGPVQFAIAGVNDSTVNVTSNYPSTTVSTVVYSVADSLCNDSMLVFTGSRNSFLVYDHKNDHIFFDYVLPAEGGYKYRIQVYKLR